MGSNPHEFNIWVINRNGSGLEQITHDGISENPDWSADGIRILFDRGGKAYTMASDGTDLQRIDLEAICEFPRWSPDGSRIACTDELRVLHVVKRATGFG